MWQQTMRVITAIGHVLALHCSYRGVACGLARSKRLSRPLVHPYVHTMVTS
jgi:hypothetical protein